MLRVSYPTSLLLYYRKGYDPYRPATLLVEELRSIPLRIGLYHYPSKGYAIYRTPSTLGSIIRSAPLCTTRGYKVSSHSLPLRRVPESITEYRTTPKVILNDHGLPVGRIYYPHAQFVPPKLFSPSCQSNLEKLALDFNHHSRVE